MVTSVRAGYATRELAPAPAADGSRRKTRRPVRSNNRRAAIVDQLTGLNIRHR